MKQNMGTTDKIIRITLALIIAGLYWGGFISGTLAIVGLILAGVLILTGFLSFCPLYLPFGLNTIRKKMSSKP